ncbi:nucleoside-diphosphate-sugar epimerase [Labedella gwakjiensis]|uniref:NAD-dependent epimerase/dehydratase family protein n=1 Tax=Labedella gwakjiensis TaxID=390269 RepID=A0A2P8GVQ5_9MICO|nr:NAD-dependent epimerase/dehydratase family protein [Labedella gwakjiensis]PSL38050.1 nucleoside-diphosphate-sugar epimerase [Labedella gwakjiensis]RUQ87390.1 NAD-dependent epimerase/dehydratase family protein [Labedella gwakjiensis]
MRVVILGGTGAIGAATAVRLLSAGWTVDLTGRDPQAAPEELLAAGARFHRIERSDSAAIGRLVGDDTDLLVDLVAFTGPDVRALLPAMRGVGRTVVVSSRAVYVDPLGRHINGDEAPEFPIPISEDNATVPPAADDVDPFTREGYAPGKVAAEHAALESGLDVAVVRPSKVHGRFARNARTRTIAQQMTADAGAIEIADGGSIDHLTAAANVASLVQTVSDRRLSGVFNAADPDPLTALEIVEAIAAVVGWAGEIVPVDDAVGGRGHHPWRAANPIVLDMSKAATSGYVPRGTARDLLADEVRWVMRAR